MAEPLPNVRIEFQVLADGHRPHHGYLTGRDLADDLARFYRDKGYEAEVQVRTVTETRWKSLGTPDARADVIEDFGSLQDAREVLDQHG